MKTLNIEAKVENLNTVLAFINEALEAADCNLKTILQIDVSVEELFVNISKYAYPDGQGNVEITVSVDHDASLCEITFSDSGVPYDPVQQEDPDITLSAEDRQIGGLGIFMVKQAMDTMTYEYRDGHNITTIHKSI